MSNSRIIQIQLLLFSSLTFLPYAKASILNAKSCSSADVQTAISSAIDGDTVLIPAGNCSWGTSVLLNQSITMKGAGASKTVIAANVDQAIYISFVGEKPFEVADMGFTGGAGDTIIAVTGSMKKWRIHNLNFNTNGAPTRLIRTNGDTYGVVDHNIAIGDTPSEFITVEDTGFSSWQRPLVSEAENAVYVEDNQVSWTGHWEGRPVIDGELGGRAVFRHNKVTNSVPINHGFDSGGGASMLQMDVYENSFTITDSMQTWARLALIRGGTGIWFNNTFTLGSNVWLTSPDIGVNVYRNDADFISSGSSSWPSCTGIQYQICGVTKDWVGSPYACTSGGLKFCSKSKVNLCSTDADCPTGESCSGFMDGPGNGYACFMQPGFGSQMKSMPIYAWGNTFTGSQRGSGSVNLFSETPNYLIDGRDIINTQMPGFVQYPYPHPLVSGSTSTMPPSTTILAAPKNLRIAP